MPILGVAGPDATAREALIRRGLDALAYAPRSPTRMVRCTGAILAVTDEAEFAVPGERHGDIAAVFDGIMDNRGDMLAALGLPAIANGADIIAALYRRDGETFAKPLHGDFCCAVYDIARRRLLLADDVIGERSVYYTQIGENLHFASEIIGLDVVPEVSKEIDEAALASLMALIPRPKGTSFRKGVAMLKSASVAVFAGGAAHEAIYFHPRDLAPIRFKRDEDYVDAMIGALGQSVRDCLKGPGAYASDLSGGLDCTMVTTLAARALAERGERMTSVTMVPKTPLDLRNFPDSFHSDGPGAKLVAGQHGNIDHVLFPGDWEPELEEAARQMAMTGAPVRTFIHAGRWRRIYEELQRRGVKTHLRGIRGNFTFSYDGAPVPPNALMRGDLVTFLREAIGIKRMGYTFLNTAQMTLGPLLPGLSDWLKGPLGYERTQPEDVTPMRPDFAKATGVWEAMQKRIATSGLSKLYGLDDLTMRISFIWQNQGAPNNNYERRAFGITSRDPTGSRRVLELALAIPDQQYMRGGETRHLARRMARRLLPPDLAKPRGRSLVAVDWNKSAPGVEQELAAELERIKKSPLAQRALDLPRIEKLIKDWPRGDWNTTAIRSAYMGVVMTGITIGTFIRRAEGINE